MVILWLAEFFLSDFCCLHQMTCDYFIFFFLAYFTFSYDNLFAYLQPPNQPQSRYSEPDNRDWRRPAQFSPSGEERSRDNREYGGRYESRQDANQFNRQDLNYQFSRAQISSNQGVRH